MKAFLRRKQFVLHFKTYCQLNFATDVYSPTNFAQIYSHREKPFLDWSVQLKMTFFENIIWTKIEEIFYSYYLLFR